MDAVLAGTDLCIFGIQAMAAIGIRPRTAAGTGVEPTVLAVAVICPAAVGVAAVGRAGIDQRAAAVAILVPVTA